VAYLTSLSFKILGVSPVLAVFYAILGILPSLVWLVFYLHKDAHPEPKKTIIKIFFLGALMGPLAIALEFLLQWLISPTLDFNRFQSIISSNSLLLTLNILLFAPLVEEYLKYAVVKKFALKNPAFDEPIDAMIYLVISALGFAALENVLSVFTLSDLSMGTAVAHALTRFLSATFLHTLSSGIFGYFLAKSLLDLKRRKIILWQGFILAASFHGFYNYLSKLLGSNANFAFAIASLLIFMSLIVSWQFYRLKKQLSICKIKR